MEICLINPPCFVRPCENNEYEYNFVNLPHIGLGYIGALLEKNGFNVDIMECTGQGISISALSQRLLEKKYDAIGISVYIYNYTGAIRIISIIKKLNPIPFIFLGGFTPSLDYNSVLSLIENCGCCIRGEGEYTCLELLEAIRDDKNWRNTPGIVYKEGKEAVVSCERKFIEDLDSLPIPKRAFVSKTGIISMITSRGCYGDCTFCELKGFQKTGTGKAIRWRSVESVVNEMELLIKQYNAKIINITDDNFLISSQSRKEWLTRFYGLMKEKGFTVELRAAARANDIISNCDIMKKLKEIGLTRIFIGIESLVQRQLDYYNKKITVEQNLRAIEILSELDMKINIGFLIFEPFASIEEIHENIRLLKNTKFCDCAEPGFYPISLRSPVLLFPGTKIREQITEKGLYVPDGKQGYKFQDENVVFLRKVILHWEEILNPIHYKYFLIYKAGENSNPGLYEALSTERMKLLKLDLCFLEDACESIEKKSMTSENLPGFIEKWKSNVKPIYQAFLDAEKFLA